MFTPVAQTRIETSWRNFKRVLAGILLPLLAEPSIIILAMPSQFEFDLEAALVLNCGTWF